MIVYKKTETAAELEGILQLQRQNLPVALSDAEKSSQGFVTVQHSYDNLKNLNEIEPHIIAKEDENVIAYLLAMTEKSQHDIPILIPMFQLFRQTPFAGKRVSDFRYIVVGQACVAKPYRGTGVFAGCYDFYRRTFQSTFDFAITEIDANNLRSLRAHQRIGFQEIHRYPAANDVEWVIVAWDWNRLSN